MGLPREVRFWRDLVWELVGNADPFSDEMDICIYCGAGAHVPLDANRRVHLKDCPYVTAMVAFGRRPKGRVLD